MRRFKYVRWVSVDEKTHEYRFTIGTLSAVITVWLRRFGGFWEYSRSHNIKTPLQDQAYGEPG